MRDINKYPITIAEIILYLEKLEKDISSEMRIGDVRPLLLRNAIKIIEKTSHAQNNVSVAIQLLEDTKITLVGGKTERILNNEGDEIDNSHIVADENNTKAAEIQKNIT